MPLTRIDDLAQMPTPDQPLVLAVGTFDGLHLGHQKVIGDARRLADDRAARLAVLRFHPHPARLLRPDQAPKLLTTETQVQAGLERLQADIHLRLPFTKELASLEAEEFLDQLKQRCPGLCMVVVGPNWRFGRQGLGDTELLQSHSREHGYQVCIAPGTGWQQEMISSTRIRRAVHEGFLDAAAAMLGHPFRLTGTVEKGKQLGRQLGFPTANLTPEQECLPPAGVYAMRVEFDGKLYDGAGYITHGESPLAEVHLLDQKMDLYGEELKLQLIKWTRPATPIHGHDELREQIEKDVQEIRSVLS